MNAAGNLPSSGGRGSQSNAKAMNLNPELKFWYAKVEHFQREVTAYAAALAGLDAARRLLGDDTYRAQEQRRPRSRRMLNRAG